MTTVKFGELYHLYTVYNTINDRPPSIALSIFGYVSFFTLTFITFFVYRKLGNNVISTLRGCGKINSFIPLIIGELIGFLFFVTSDIETRNLYEHDLEVYKSDKLKTVEGIVTDYYPEPEDGHGEESFVVNGVEFHYSYNESGRSGYHRSASHGGAIKPNLYVRIRYFYDGDRNAILRLDTKVLPILKAD